MQECVCECEGTRGHGWTGLSGCNSFSPQASTPLFLPVLLGCLELLAAAPLALWKSVIEESAWFLPDTTLSHSTVGLWVCPQQPGEFPSLGREGCGDYFKSSDRHLLGPGCLGVRLRVAAYGVSLCHHL